MSTYTDLLNASPKGWRLRRSGELIKAGDLEPDGPVWKPIEKHRIGAKVDGCSYSRDGGPNFVMGMRRRNKKEPNDH